MQNKDYITSEIDRNKEVFYASDELKNLIENNSHDQQKSISLITSKDTFDVTILMYRKSKSKTSIKLLIKKNILTRLILCNILKLQIKDVDLEILNIDFNQNKLIKSNIYLNNNEDTIVKIKFLNESEN